jgi:drug/metabolite transporter (DMT)-like permease
MTTAPAGAAVSGVRYTLLALLFTFLWTSAFIVVKIGLRDAPPLFLMSSRFFLAGGALLVFARLRGRPLPARARDWWPIVVLGVLNFALYLGFTALSLREISAGMGAVLASTNPLLLALGAAWLLGERLTALKVVGLLVSFGGVTWIMESRLGSDNTPRGMVFAFLAVASLVVGTLVFKRIGLGHDRLVTTAGQLLTAGVVLGVPSLLWEPIGSVRWTPSYLAVQAYLIVGLSWVAMLIWFWLLAHGDATRASAYFFLNPVLGLFMGALVLGEPLRGADFAGAAAVALGIWLVQRA